jgi:hypothetical protein
VKRRRLWILKEEDASNVDTSTFSLKNRPILRIIAFCILSNKLVGKYFISFQY